MFVFARDMGRRNLKLVAILAGMILFALMPHSASANVTVSYFTASWSGSKVAITWGTATELNNAGFNIYRSTTQNGTYNKINTSGLIPSLCIGCVGGIDYSYNDTTVSAGVAYYYKLEAIDNSGSKQSFGPVTAAPSATPTFTPTKVPPTNTPTVTPTSTSTPTPTLTPTITPTYPPGVTPPTPLPTSTPQPTSTVQSTPTRTQTYPPGVKPPTPKPASVTPPPLVAVVPPGSTPALPNANPAVPTVSNSTSTDSSAVSSSSSSNDTTTDQPIENGDSGAPTDQNSTMQTLLRVGVILTIGMLGLGAVVFGAIAIFLFVRMSSHR